MENLWDTHPPFQIDGNFGGTSGIAEMLLQSHNGVITPIPAIPDAWKTGSFNGLKARGGYTIAASWNNKILTGLQINSVLDKTCTVALDSGWIVYSDTGVVEPSSYDPTAKTLSFEAQAGRFYHLSKTLLNTQTITFPAIGDQVITSRAVNLSATTSSGLPVSFSVVSGPAAVRGTVLTLTGLGSVTVRALQVGNSNYARSLQSAHLMSFRFQMVPAPVSLASGGRASLALTSRT